MNNNEQDHPPKCKGVRNDGQPCNAYATATGYCYVHDPHRTVQRKRASERGGRARKELVPRIVLSEPKPIKLRNVGNILHIVEQCVSELRRINPKTNKMKLEVEKAIANIALRALEVLGVQALSEKMAVLEEEIRAERKKYIGPLGLPEQAPWTEGDNDG